MWRKKTSYTQPYARQAMRERKKDWLLVMWEREKERGEEQEEVHYIYQKHIFSRWTHNRIKKSFSNVFFLFSRPPIELKSFSSSLSSFLYTFSLSHSLFQLLYVHILMLLLLLWCSSLILSFMNHSEDFLKSWKITTSWLLVFWFFCCCCCCVYAYVLNVYIV